MGTLKYTYPLTLPSETLQGMAAALAKNNRNFEGFLNSTVIRKESDGTVALPATSTVGGKAISTVDRLNDLEDVTTTLPANRHFLIHNGTKFVNRVFVQADISDFHRPPIPITIYIEKPAKTSTEEIHGDIEILATAQALDSVPTDLVVSLGINRIFVMVIAGSDVTGSITITGTSVDRDTGVETGSDTEVLTISGVSTDARTTDANGTVVWDLTNGYLSTKWFTGATVTLSTTDLTLTDVDVFGVSMEQMDDDPSFQLDTFDVGLFATNVAAEFDAYLYIVEQVSGDKYDITALASVHLGAVGNTAIANKHYRLRRSALAKTLDGTVEGWFLEAHFANSPAYIEDVFMTIWDIHP